MIGSAGCIGGGDIGVDAGRRRDHAWAGRDGGWSRRIRCRGHGGWRGLGGGRRGLDLKRRDRRGALRDEQAGERGECCGEDETGQDAHLATPQALRELTKSGWGHAATSAASPPRARTAL